VQLAAVPLPITRLGLLVSSARASGGTAALPAGLPAGAMTGWAGVAVVVVGGTDDGGGAALTEVVAAGELVGAETAVPSTAPAQPEAATTTVSTAANRPRMADTLEGPITNADAAANSILKRFSNPAIQ
jgi:hypothetical protein